MAKARKKPEAQEANTRFKALPNSKLCGTKPIGDILSFGDCLVKYPLRFAHVIFFGNGQICNHPNWKAFVGSSAKPIKKKPRNPAR